MEFSQWFNERLRLSNMSVMEFTEKSRISKPMVYFFKQGNRLPTPSTAAKIAEAFKVPLEDVLVFARKGLGRPKK